MSKLELEFDERPSVAAYMVRALYPGFMRKPPPFPALRAHWRAKRPDRARLAQLVRLTGLGIQRGLPILYPQALTFPLQMVILTHPIWPFPIWKVLQVRNSLLQYRAIPAEAAIEAEAAAAAQRVLAKGLEVDLRVTARVEGEIAWVGVTTYLYRGRFGDPGPPDPLAIAPAQPGTEAARWRTDSGGGLRFSGVSGDYNGIHYSGAYARLLGFRGAFHHPHAVVGQCLARLTEPTPPAQRLDLWLKGPVYYGSELRLTVTSEEAGMVFGLTANGGSRAEILGRWTSGAAATT
jgi:acyl dehydratase